MAEKDYTSMLNITYEIEGLLVLLDHRDDERSDSIRRLVVEKVDRLRSMMEDGSLAGSESHVTAKSEPGTAGSYSTPPTTVDNKAVQPSPLVTLEEADPELAEIEGMPAAPERPVGTEANVKPRQTAYGVTQAVRKPLSFTLNDKFRFRRELFDNNDIEFADAVNVLSAMNNLGEAEDYLYNDLCWDPSNEDVQAFISILTDYFK